LNYNADKNNIMNIEAICWMNFPNLISISLSDNKISKITCFKKLLSPELCYLILSASLIIK